MPVIFLDQVIKERIQMKKFAASTIILAIIFIFSGASYADLKDGSDAHYPVNGSADNALGRPSGIFDDASFHKHVLSKAKINAFYRKERDVAQKVIEFSHCRWTVRNSSDASDIKPPGPNLWSNRKSDVWVDGDGRLHLKIIKRDGKWYCTEVTCDKTFGYGTYVFYMDSKIENGNMDPNVVLGFFTYDYHTCDTNASSEIDIEFSKYGGRNENILNYSVQPCIVTGGRPTSECYKRHKVFPVEMHGKYSTHVFVWKDKSVQFYSYHGHGNPTPNPIVKDGWSYNITAPNCKYDRQSGAKCNSKLIGIPKATIHTNVKINFWLFEGKAPREEQHVVIDKFEYIPASVP